jgi:hypothetical protein
MEDIYINKILPQLHYMSLLQFKLINKYYNHLYNQHRNQILFNCYQYKNIKLNPGGIQIHQMCHELYSKMILYLKHHITLPLWADYDKFILIETVNCIKQYIHDKQYSIYEILNDKQFLLSDVCHKPNHLILIIKNEDSYIYINYSDTIKTLIKNEMIKNNSYYISNINDLFLL